LCKNASRQSFSCAPSSCGLFFLRQLVALRPEVPFIIGAANRTWNEMVDFDAAHPLLSEFDGLRIFSPLRSTESVQGYAIYRSPRRQVSVGQRAERSG
jgi:hypothetical protein